MSLERHCIATALLSRERYYKVYCIVESTVTSWRVERCQDDDSTDDVIDFVLALK